MKIRYFLLALAILFFTIVVPDLGPYYKEYQIKKIFPVSTVGTWQFQDDSAEILVKITEERIIKLSYRLTPVENEHASLSAGPSVFDHKYLSPDGKGVWNSLSKTTVKYDSANNQIEVFIPKQKPHADMEKEKFASLYEGLEKILPRTFILNKKDVSEDKGNL